MAPANAVNWCDLRLALSSSLSPFLSSSHSLSPSLLTPTLSAYLPSSCSFSIPSFSHSLLAIASLHSLFVQLYHFIPPPTLCSVYHFIFLSLMLCSISDIFLSLISLLSITVYLSFLHISSTAILYSVANFMLSYTLALFHFLVLAPTPSILRFQSLLFLTLSRTHARTIPVSRV